MCRSPGASLLVDLGTNAEIVVASGTRTWVTSAAAGPAFEGAGITCGGPAASGAVTSVHITGDGGVAFEVIGDTEPLWLSGSGVVSLMARLREFDHVDEAGLFHQEGPLAARFTRDAAGVVRFELGDGEGCLSLSQLDARAVQLAKAAIQVGIRTVLGRAGLRATDLANVYIAGAFGFSVSTADLIALGLLPTEWLGVARRVGNAALDGAAALALDRGLEQIAEDMIASATGVELALDAGFNEAFIAAMALEPFSA